MVGAGRPRPRRNPCRGGRRGGQSQRQPRPGADQSVSAAPPQEYAAGSTELPPASGASGPQDTSQNQLAALNRPAGDCVGQSTAAAATTTTIPAATATIPAATAAIRSNRLSPCQATEAGGYTVGATGPNMANQAPNHSPSGTPYPANGNAQGSSQPPGTTDWEKQANPNMAGESYPAQVDQPANPRPSSSPTPDWGQTAPARRRTTRWRFSRPRPIRTSTFWAEPLDRASGQPA